jgi:choline dehydrogenase
VQTVRGREIVLSAGAVHSPAVLLRSGIGPRGQLEQLGIAVVHDLPGVGEHLIEHPMASIVGVPKPGVAQAGDPLQQIGLRFTAPGSDEPNDMQAYMWHYDATTSPRIAEMAGPEGSVFIMAVTLQRPKSRGRIELASADPETPPRIDANLLDHPDDRARLAASYRMAWELVQSPALAEVVGHVFVPEPGIMEDDEALAAHLHGTVTHLVHPVGTCRMGPEDDTGAVVAQHGHVHGIEGLRVADASIMPSMPRANTNLTAIMIGERVAEFMGPGE